MCARGLTKAEKEKIKLYALIDAKRWRLTGTLVLKARAITRQDLKTTIEKKSTGKYPQQKQLHGRAVIIVNANIWAEEILSGDEL